MAFLIIAVTLVLSTTLLTEYLAQQKKIKNELARKITHVISAFAIAASPFFIDMKVLPFLGAIDIIAMIIVSKFNIFPAAQSVERKTHGEIWFAVGFTITSLLTNSKWIFAAAILYLGLADAAAALVGKKFGIHRYKFFGHEKSIEGSLALALTAMAITIWVVWLAPAGLSHAWPVIFWLPCIAALVEAAIPLGLDNIALPVLVAVVLNFLQTV
jgi:phytol kinase